MHSEKCRVSAIIPCRNEARFIEKCVCSALGQKTRFEEFEIIVVDGMSEDGTREILAELAQSHAQMRVLDNPKRIVSAGLNAALQVARGEIIVRMDAHTEFAQDYIETCVDTLMRTGASNVGGPARTKPRTYLERAISAAYHSPFSVGGARFHDITYEGYVDTVTYGCWAREAFERFGYFDEELVRNQDDEHNLRICRGGGKIWQSPDIKSWYRPRGSLKALFEQYMQYGYWKVRVIQKHKVPASWRHLVPGTFLLALILSLAAAVFSQAFGGLLPVAKSVTRPALLGFSSLLLMYCLGVLIASVHTASQTEWKLLPLLPLAFFCYHFGYGFGFLAGVWDFWIRRGHRDSGFARLTR
jgi:glycosyltransferase involved in cell wall biosynthesis